VAPDGNDDNPGSEAQPFRTIARGVSALGPGDTLYVREGTYHEQVTVYTSGTADSSITISAYPGEVPVIDAQDTLPGDYDDYLIVLRGDHITLNGMEIKNVYGTAVMLRGNYNIVRNMRIHHCLSKGIYVGGDHNTVEDNEVWMASLIHEEISQGGRWTGGINVARYPEYTVVRRNTVHDTWGFGVQVFEAYDTTIEDNVVWNCQMSHYYVNNAPNTLVQRNLSYNTPDSVFLYGGYPGNNIGFCDEGSSPLSHNVRIINNLGFGGNRGFHSFSQPAGGGLKEFLIAHNIFVDSHTAGLTIRAGSHENSKIQNNIFLEEVGTIAVVEDDPNLSFSNNLWSQAPPSSASGAGDIIGDPLLAQSGPTGPGLLSPDWFKPLSDSPAVDSGVTLDEVPDDFDRVPRPHGAGYDIGAFESPFSSRVTDLRVVTAIAGMSGLTVTLVWTAPAAAVTYTLRSSDTLLTPANWEEAPIVPVPFTASAPGSREWLTTAVDYAGGVLYMALKSQNQVGSWSELSNNAFWPYAEIHLPLVMKDYTRSFN
jgi:hypothetical protein